MEIKSLDGIGFDTIYGAFAKAFADYELQQNQDQLRAMLTRRGFDPCLSFAALEGGEIISFTFNGTGLYRGVPTAYDTGTGTLEEYRGQGLATKIFNYSIPYLQKAGIVQYLLEVLQHNTGAVSVYSNIGFQTTREFNYFRIEKKDIFFGKTANNPAFTIRRIALHGYNSLSGFWDFTPSWQNSFEAIERSPGSFIALGVFADDHLVGYSVFEPASGDVTQIAVDKPWRRKGVGTILMREMVGLSEIDVLKIINTDIECESITAFLASLNIKSSGKQFEMIKKL